MATWRTWRVLAAAGLAVGAAAAQPTPTPADDPEDDPAADPALLDESLERLREQLEGGRPDADSVPPTPLAGVRPGPAARADLTSIPGLDVTLDVPPASLLPESTLLVRRAGALVKAPTGERVFVFLPAADEPAAAAGDAEPAAGALELPPMVLIPCGTLERIERFASGDGGLEYFTISGEIFLYRGRNYLRPTAFSVSPLREADREAQPETRADETQAEAAEAVAPSGDREADPDVQRLIEDLEARREVARGLSVEALEEEARQLAERGSAAAASDLGWSEGGTLLRRRGRLTRLAGGEWAFVTDAGTRDRNEAPLVLVPSLALMTLEAIAGQAGDARAIELSGRVLTYRTRAYLIPTLFVMETPTDLEPQQ